MMPPDKSPLPTDGLWHWRKRYFDVGDQIAWRYVGDAQISVGKVVKIKVNNKGRVSYFVADHFVLTEDLSRAEHDNDLSRTAP